MAPEQRVRRGRSATGAGCMVGTLVGAVIGSSCVGLIFVTGLNVTWDLKSSDFLSAVLSALGVMLAGVSVLLALLALALAAGAIYGWQEFKRRTGEAAAQKAADVAGPVAVEVAVPAAIKQVDAYLDKNLDPEIRQKVIAIVSQIVTPEFVRDMIGNGNVAQPPSRAHDAAPERAFSDEIVKAAATEEVNRQEGSLEAFDAIVEAEKMRGEDEPTQGDDA